MRKCNIFFYIIIAVKQLTRQNTKGKNINKTLGEKNTPLSLAKYFKE